MKSYDPLFGENSYEDSKNCSVIQGNSIDISLQEDDCEVRADIVVAKVYNVRVWGQVIDCDGMPVSSALVKLIKPRNVNCTVEYEGIAHTITDCNGFYQFDVPTCDMDNTYKILVSKSSIGNERKILGGNCTPCESNRPVCEPCQQVSQRPLKPTYQNNNHPVPNRQSKPIYQNNEQPLSNRPSKPIYQNNDQDLPNRPAKPIYPNNDLQQRTGYKPNDQVEKIGYVNNDLQQRTGYKPNDQGEKIGYVNNDQQQKPIYQNNESKAKPLYQGNEQQQQPHPANYQANENIDRAIKSDSEQTHNPFYGDAINKSNIFKKHE